jgi:hypothetical protein
MFIHLSVWVEIQFDWKFQSNIKRGRKKIDGNNDNEKVPRKSEENA